MHLQNNGNDEYSDIPKLIIKRFPNFNPLFDLDEGPYLILGDFYHNYILKNIDNDTTMKEVCEFINEQMSIEYYAIKELIQIEIFEHCLYDDRILNILNKYLNNEAKEYLNNFLRQNNG